MLSDAGILFARCLCPGCPRDASIRRLGVWFSLELLLLLSWAVESQGTTSTTTSFLNDGNGSNGSEPNCTDNETLVNSSNYSGLPLCPKPPPPPCIISSCHNEMRREARNSCKEFTEFGANEARCNIWEFWAEKTCKDTCSDCEAIGKVMFEQCMFTLQIEMDFGTAIAQCKIMRQTFQDLRCPSAAIDKIEMCYNPVFDACNLECGNYYQCDCWQNRGLEGSPDQCEGETVLPGFDGLPENCDKFPTTCKNHLPNTLCGIYKHCPPNFCIIKGVTCPIMDSCQSVGVCAPGDGNCYYSTLPDGSSCDDGLFYTHSDRCKDAVCIGVEDKCERYDVKCHTANSCLVPTDKVKDACDPPTGSCVFNARPDGTLCQSQPGGQTDGTCVAGLCRRNVLNKCEGKVCPAKDFCFGPSECEPWTGECIALPKPEGEECDDGDASTVGDRCIEGQCIGHKSASPEYAFQGQEQCDGKYVSREALRYYGTVMREEECKDQCSADPGCIAYTYGYYVCYIYGGSRTVDPSEEYWGRKWLLLDPSAMPSIAHGSICYTKTDTGSPFIVGDQKAAWFSVTVTILTVIPGAWGLFMVWKPVSKSFRSLTGCCDGEIEEDEDELPFEDFSANLGKWPPPEIDTQKAGYLHDSVDDVQPPSPEGSGAIGQNPAASIGEDGMESVKLNQATPPEEAAPPHDPRGEVDNTEENPNAEADGRLS